MKRNRTVIPFAGCLRTDPRAREDCRLVFVGLSNESQSSLPARAGGCARAPGRIRLAYDGNCYNATTESGVDLAGAVTDLGDVPSETSWKKTAERYRELAESLFGGGKVPFFAGGDHAVTVPIVAALAVLGKPVHVVQIDAHPDLYPEYEGSRSSHACTAARLLELEHVASITQFGIRTANAIQVETARRFRGRLHQYAARDLAGELPLPPHIGRSERVYLTVDLDGFDPAFAPGVSHPVPGGLSARQVLNLIQCAEWELVGMDAVEVNPDLDVGDRTAILAARLLHEAMGYATKRTLPDRGGDAEPF